MMPAYWAAMPRMPPTAGLETTGAVRWVDRLAAWGARSGTATTTGFGLGLGFGLAVALKPMTPKASATWGAAAFGACTATGAAAVEAPLVAGRAAGAAEAGRAKEATRPPDAAMTAVVFTAGWADFAAMPASSETGLKRPGARWRPAA